MVVKVSLKILLGIVTIIIVFVSILFIFFFRFPKLKPCEAFKNFYAKSDCGYVASTVDRTAHLFIVRVESVEKKGNLYFVNSLLKDSQGHPLRESIMLYPPKNGILLTTKPPFGEMPKPGENQKNLSASDVSDILERNQEYIFYLLTPDSKMLSGIKMTSDVKEALRCLPYQKEFISYVQNPSFIAWLSLRFDKFKTGCNVQVLQIDRI